MAFTPPSDAVETSASFTPPKDSVESSGKPTSIDTEKAVKDTQGMGAMARGSAEALADLVLSVPGFAISQAAGAGFSAGQILRGEKPDTAYRAGNMLAADLGEKLTNPVHKIMSMAKATDEYEKSPVTVGLSKFNEFLQSGAKKIETYTGVPASGIEQLVNVTMAAAGAAGGEAASSTVAAKVRAESPKAPTKPVEGPSTAAPKADDLINQWKTKPKKTVSEQLELPLSTKLPTDFYDQKAAEAAKGSKQLDLFRDSPIQQTAFRNKETGDVELSGRKHDIEKKKDSSLEPGFIDQSGNFYTRKEAEKVARENGQIEKEQQLEKPEEGLHSGDIRSAEAKKTLGGMTQASFAHLLSDITGEPSHIKDVMELKTIPAETREAMVRDALRQRNLEQPKGEQLTLEEVLPPELSGEQKAFTFDPVEAAKETFKLGKSFLTEGERIFSEQGEAAAREFLEEFSKMSAASGMKTTEDVSDRFFRVQSSGDATQTLLRQNYDAAKKAGLDDKTSEAILDKFGKGMEVSPAEESKIDKFFSPMKQRINDLYAEANKINPEAANAVMEEMGLNRLAVHTGKWKNFFEGIYAGNMGGFGAYGAKPSAMKGRTIFKLGNKIVSRVGDDIIAWDNGEATYIGTTRKAFRAGEEFKGEKITDVLDQREIEGNVPNVRYADPFFAHTVKLAEMEKYVDQMKAMEELKSSPVGQQMMRREGEAIPEGFRPLTNQNLIPQLRGYSIDPKLAEVLEDYLRPGQPVGSIGRTLEAINGFSVKMFMLNPLPHIGNEAAHYFVGRGLISGWVDPRGLAQVANLPDAWKSVMSQDHLQIEIARNGGSLMSMSIRNHNWMRKVMDAQIAKADASTGLVSKVATLLGDTYKNTVERLSKASNLVMWTARDTMYTSMIMERMSRFKEDMPTAIKQVDKFMPSYRLPSRVGMDNAAGRFLSNVMQNKAATVFSRYHYGMVRAIKEAFKDLGIAGKRLEGLDHLAAYAIGLGVVYPMLDYLYRSIYGNDVRARRQGGFHLLDSLMKVAIGEKPGEAVASSLVTPSPALTAAYSGLTSRDYFTGKTIRIPEDTIYGQAYDVAKYFGAKAAPVAGLADVAGGKKTPREWMLQQQDIEVTPKEKEIKREQARKRRITEAKKRQKERGF